MRVILVIRDLTWVGTLVSRNTEKKMEIGGYALPAGTQGVAPSQLDSVEYLPWDSGSHACGSLPYTGVVFGRPTTKRGGAGPGIIANAHEDSDCVGKLQLKTSSTKATITIEIGYPR